MSKLKMETMTENNYTLNTNKAKLLKKSCSLHIEDYIIQYDSESCEEIFVVPHSIRRSLGTLGVGDLVNDQTNSTFGNNIRDAIANLDAHHCMSRVEAQHWDKVHDWVCAPADHCPDLCSLDLAPH